MSLVTVAIVGFAGIVAASDVDSQERPAAASRTGNRRVAVVQGTKPARIEVGEIVRVEGTVPSGMGEVSVKTEGPVRLIATNDIRQVIDGAVPIGAMTREFEVRAQKPGKARVIVTIDNKIANKVDTLVFALEIQ